MKRLMRWVLTTLSTILAVTALLLTAQEMNAETAYRELGKHSKESVTGNGTSERDWSRIRDENEDTVGWITVEGTSIDYPVVQPSNPTESNFYLSHNFWRQADVAGCPYLDVRSSVTGAHMMIFGHRLGPTNRMFGSLSNSWKQEFFEGLGEAHLDTPDRDFAFSPLCALKVDCDFSDIQRFDFESDEEMRMWLSELVQRAGARHAKADSLITRAERLLTLVTCSNPRSGGRERTLVIFVART